jgi:large subunit ribosomal protein L18
MSQNNRKEQRTLRHRRLRQTLKGSPERPRMAIFISNKHMYVQFIDDIAGNTLACASSVKTEGITCTLAGAKTLGEEAAKAALEKGVKQVVIDRGGFKFTGRVKQIVEAAVAAGLVLTDKPPKAPKEKPKAVEGESPREPKSKDAPKADKPKAEKKQKEQKETK